MNDFVSPPPPTHPQHMHIHTHVTHTHTHTHIYTHIHTHTQKYTCIYSFSHSHTHTHTHTYTHVFTHTHTCILMHTHARTHTHTHTHTHTLNAAVEIANVTTGLGEDTSFFCNVTGTTQNNVQFQWLTTMNGVYQSMPFPQPVFDDRVRGTDSNTLRISFVGPLDDQFAFTCIVSVGGMLVVSKTAFLTVNSKQHMVYNTAEGS